jgi:hypothetical protein
LLGYFLKPLCDLTHLTFVVGSRIGVKSLAIFLLFFGFADWALTRVKNSLPKSLKECAVETQRLESELRDRHSKIHTSREQIVRCAFFDINLHSRMLLDPTPVFHLKLLHACDQRHSSRVSTNLTITTINYAET